MAFRPVSSSTSTYITAGPTVGTAVINANGTVVKVTNAGSQPAWVLLGPSSPVSAAYQDLPVLPLSEVYLDRASTDLFVGCLSSATAQTTLYFTTGFETR